MKNNKYLMKTWDLKKEVKKEMQIIDGNSEMYKGVGLQTTNLQILQNDWAAKWRGKKELG